MKSSNKQHAAMAATVLLALTTLPSFGGGDDADIFPINSHPYGKSYGQWAVAWWQWGLGIPAAENPLLDTTGAFADVGQSGPVWFLGSTFGDSEERTLTIPHGKAIFMPVYQWIFGAGVGDCDPSNPGVVCDVPTLRADAAAPTLAVQTLEVRIDEEPVRHIRQYRAISPGTFSVTFPEGAVFGLPAGTTAPQVADGYWLMLEPLKPGNHTIRVRVVNPDFGSDFHVIYHIKINH